MEINPFIFLLLPGDSGYDEAQLQIIKRRAEHLSTHGWKFLKQEGPRGIYFDGIGPAGKRVMSEQCSDPRAAFQKAVNHAHDVQFS